FVAATFKRGIACINIPTSLLGAVDAAVGGKTGVNFDGLKNEIGAFCPAKVVVINTKFFQTLDRQNLLSGYAEMLKHGLISSQQHWAELLNFDLNTVDYQKLQELLAASVSIKERIVQEDPFEQGIRKALNVGHTAGHAFESFSFEKQTPLLHGYAIAYGMICELYLSHRLARFPADKMRQTIRFIRDHYGLFPISCVDYPRLCELMKHDKKNESGNINFTLLADIGNALINQTVEEKTIVEMLDFYRES
ncbi:MAG: 3-dehydroquinate synthase, partial [Bacteroidales bacterium]|nr:3-dehydroquinate synthase [Bacteroidales bacterium]